MANKDKQRKPVRKKRIPRVRPRVISSDPKPSKLPDDAVLADPTQQVPNNSYSPPPEYYVDQEFVCVDCGRKEIWTATQQKWYYEVAKGSLYAGAVRCRACRRKHRETHSGVGDPNPIKHLGSLRKHLRSRIDPLLMEAGFQFDRESGKAERWSMWIEYVSPTQILRCEFGHCGAHLTAVSLTDAEWISAVDVELGSVHSTSAVLESLDQFAKELRRFVHGE